MSLAADQIAELEDKIETNTGHERPPFHHIHLRQDHFAWAIEHKYTDFRQSEIIGATLTDATHQLDFRRAEIYRCNFTNAKLNYSSFEYTQIKDTDFTGASLACVNFNHRNIRYSSFKNGKLIGALFERTEQFSNNFTGAYLDDARFIYSDLALSDFSEADLSGAWFEYCNLKSITYDTNTKFNPICHTIIARILVDLDLEDKEYLIAGGVLLQHNRCWPTFLPQAKRFLSQQEYEAVIAKLKPYFSKKLETYGYLPQCVEA